MKYFIFILLIGISCADEMDFDKIFNSSEVSQKTFTVDNKVFKDNKNKNDTAFVESSNEDKKAVSKFLSNTFKGGGQIDENGQLRYVMVRLNFTCGLFGSCSPKNLKIWGGPGRFNPNFNGASTGSIQKGYNNTLAGWYQWTGEYGSDGRACSGSLYLSGTKQNYRISIYSDGCRDASSGEH